MKTRPSTRLLLRDIDNLEPLLSENKRFLFSKHLNLSTKTKHRFEWVTLGPL